jgi:hypothetical protein
MADSVNLAMASSIRVIHAIQDELKSLKKTIEDHLKTIPQTLIRYRVLALFLLPVY